MEFLALDGNVSGPEPRMARSALRAGDRHRGEQWLCAGRVPKSLFSAPFAFPIHLIRRLTILCRGALRAAVTQVFDAWCDLEPHGESETCHECL